MQPKTKEDDNEHHSGNGLAQSGLATAASGRTNASSRTNDTATSRPATNEHHSGNVLAQSGLATAASGRPSGVPSAASVQAEATSRSMQAYGERIAEASKGLVHVTTQAARKMAIGTSGKGRKRGTRPDPDTVEALEKVEGLAHAVHTVSRHYLITRRPFVKALKPEETIQAVELVFNEFGRQYPTLKAKVDEILPTVEEFKAAMLPHIARGLTKGRQYLQQCGQKAVESECTCLCFGLLNRA